MILVGGSKLDAALRAALAVMAPEAVIREFYGAAEASFITLADAATPEASVGRAYPGVEIALDPGGEVWVKSPYLFLGYANNPSPPTPPPGGGGEAPCATASAFRPSGGDCPLARRLACRWAR